MVTVTYDALNDLVHDTAAAIEQRIGLNPDILNLFTLNDRLVAYLEDYGVIFEDVDDPDEEA